jgi:hypothetical protein
MRGFKLEDVAYIITVILHFMKSSFICGVEYSHHLNIFTTNHEKEIRNKKNEDSLDMCRVQYFYNPLKSSINTRTESRSG